MEISHRITIEYTRKYWFGINKQTNTRSCTIAPNQLPKFGKMELSPYVGAPYNSA